MSKIGYFVTSFLALLTPKSCLNKSLKNYVNKLNSSERQYVLERVQYYNKQQVNFNVSKAAVCAQDFHFKNNGSFYYFDLKKILHHFNQLLYFDYQFGDVTKVPPQPTIVKSRPLDEDNAKSVVMKLDSHRHFRFVNDRLAYSDKLNQAVFRGPCYQKHRQDFLTTCFGLQQCNIGDTRASAKAGKYYKPFMTIKNMLKYKFIISVEGNDVATNLKWIMSSNSLCFMRRPRFETWFMEGKLEPDKHYVLLKDDYSDLQEKISYYSSNQVAAERIIQQANLYVRQFQDAKRERLISLLTLQKYFLNSNQLVGGDVAHFSQSILESVV